MSNPLTEEDIWSKVTSKKSRSKPKSSKSNSKKTSNVVGGLVYRLKSSNDPNSRRLLHNYCKNRRKAIKRTEVEH